MNDLHRHRGTSLGRLLDRRRPLENPGMLLKHIKAYTVYLIKPASHSLCVAERSTHVWTSDFRDVSCMQFR